MKKIFDNLEEILSAILFVIMFGILIAQIIYRQILNSPLVWSEELAILLFVYIGLLGISMGIKKKQHVYIDFLYKKFPEKFRKIADVFINVVVFLSITGMIVIGYKVFLRKRIFELIALKISAGWMYIALPLIGILMLIRFIQSIFQSQREGEK